MRKTKEKKRIQYNQGMRMGQEIGRAGIIETALLFV